MCYSVHQTLHSTLLDSEGINFNNTNMWIYIYHLSTCFTIADISITYFTIHLFLQCVHFPPHVLYRAHVERPNKVDYNIYTYIYMILRN